MFKNDKTGGNSIQRIAPTPRRGPDAEGIFRDRRAEEEVDDRRRAMSADSSVPSWWQLLELAIVTARLPREGEGERRDCVEADINPGVAPLPWSDNSGAIAPSARNVRWPTNVAPSMGPDGAVFCSMGTRER